MIIAGIRSMFFCYAGSTKFASNSFSYFTLTNCTIVILASSILPYRHNNEYTYRCINHTNFWLYNGEFWLWLFTISKEGKWRGEREILNFWTWLYNGEFWLWWLFMISKEGEWTKRWERNNKILNVGWWGAVLRVRKIEETWWWRGGDWRVQ